VKQLSGHQQNGTTHKNARCSWQRSLTSMDDESSSLLRLGSRAPPDMALDVAAPQRFLSCRHTQRTEQQQQQQKQHWRNIGIDASSTQKR
jgi:hypothetical protein